MKHKNTPLMAQLATLNEHELRRLLIEHLAKQKLGLVWEHTALERDKALNADIVLPRLSESLSCHDANQLNASYRNLIIEGDNFDALRLLRTTHANKIRVIYIDPPYNTGNKDWVYNDDFVGKNDRWRHSQWLEFLYRRLTLARDLLTPDGVMLVSINDENRSRLDLLLEEIFPGGRVGSLTWRTKDTGNDNGRLLSQVHEHVLVFANDAFRFNGRGTDRSKFRNPDSDPNGDWAPRPLTKAHTFEVREGTYYPIQDPKTGYWYPCDPDRVWAYASKHKITKKKLRSATIEELIEKDLIYFPPCKPSEVMNFKTMADLVEAINKGKGPVSPRKKTPLLRIDLPDLDFWVGKPIATGRPSLKDYWTSKPQSERLAPLSSWIGGLNEDIDFALEDDEFDPVSLRSARAGVANDELKALLGTKKFDYPKPLSLIQGLLAQTTREGDIVLDFFAGSGTTAHAVLALNAEDEGERRFILCSNTEASRENPDRNVCRDVCAERVRKIIGKKGGDFGYIELERLNPADAGIDASADQVFQLLALRESMAVRPVPLSRIKIVASSDELAIVYVPDVNAETLGELLALPQQRLAIYSSRPKTIAERLEIGGKVVNSYSIGDVIMAGQAVIHEDE